MLLTHKFLYLFLYLIAIFFLTSCSKKKPVKTPAQKEQQEQKQFKEIKPTQQTKFYDAKGNLSIEILSDIDGVVKKKTYSYYDDNTLRSKTYYLNEQKHGNEYIYHPNTELKISSYYLQGKLNGAFKSYYNSGSLDTYAFYANGKIDGQSEMYYENGTLKNRVNMFNGMLHGFSHEYYCNGNIKSISNFKYGKTKSKKSYTKDGKLLKDLKYGSGVVNTYDEFGDLNSTLTYFRGNLVDTQIYKETIN